MEAKHKIKAREKQLAKEMDVTSSDADDLSDFEDVQPKLAIDDLIKKDEEERAAEQKKFFFTPEDLTQRLIVVLDNASLETALTKRGFELLNMDDHHWLITKKKRNPEDYRPDIVHQCLMSLLDSPLNKNGKLQVFLRTQKGHTIEVNPNIRLPRTFKRFSGLFAQLMTQGKIQEKAGGSTLLSVNNFPIKNLVPSESKFIRLNYLSKGNLVDNFTQYSSGIQKNINVFVVSLKPEADNQLQLQYTDDICISNYDLTGLYVCSKLCFAFEEHWDVL